MSCPVNLFSIAKNVLISVLVALLFFKQKRLSSQKNPLKEPQKPLPKPLKT